MNMLDIDLLLDNAATASQHPALLEPEVREAIRNNIVTPLLKRIHMRDLAPATDFLILSEAQMSMAEFMAMVAARDIALKVKASHVDLAEAEKVYNAAWDALAAKVRNG